MIYERLNRDKNEDAVLDSTRKHLEEFGDAGLRTLCLSYAEVDPAFYDSWNNKFQEARTLIEGREKALMEVRGTFSDSFLGGTLIEAGPLHRLK